MVPPTAIDLQSVTDTQVAMISGPLSVNGVSARRNKAPKMDGGLVAASSSEMFKGPVSNGLGIASEGARVNID